MFLTDLLRSVNFLVTDVSSVASVDFLALFVTAEGYFLGIDDDNVVASVNVRSEDSLVLSTEEFGCGYGNFTKRLVFGVDDVPLAFNVLCFCGKGFHKIRLIGSFGKVSCGSVNSCYK